MLSALLLTLAVVAYNNVASLLPEGVREPGYLLMNSVAGVALGLIAWRLYRLGAADLGLAHKYLLRGTCWGSGVGLGIVALVFAAFLTPFTASFLDDARAAGLTTGTFLYTALVRIPLGTALFEEWAFRGVLYGVWRKTIGVRRGVLVSSVAFGLWHIVPSLDALFANRPEAGVGLAFGWVLLSVVSTTVGGVFFSLLRLYSGSLAAPALAHALMNSFSLAAAFIARGG